jgi:hypothetical protein
MNNNKLELVEIPEEIAGDAQGQLHEKFIW